jgi:hypothetical protein
MDLKALHRIERLNYIFGVVLIAVSIFATRQSFALGISIGVVLCCANFSLIRRLVAKLLKVAPEKRGITAFYFIPKMAGLMGLVALAIFFLPISPLGLGIGFSIFLLSIMVESIRFMTGSAISH